MKHYVIPLGFDRVESPVVHPSHGFKRAKKAVICVPIEHTEHRTLKPSSGANTMRKARASGQCTSRLSKFVGNYIHVKTYTMLATRRVGFLFFSRPTVWGEVGEGNFALPPAHAQLHGPARAFRCLSQSYPMRSRP